MKNKKNLRSQIGTSSCGGRTDEEFSNWKSHTVMSIENLNLKSQFATLEKWDSLRSQNVTIEGRCGDTYGIAKCDTFKAVSGQQAVAQLTQNQWRQNITKNLPDEFRSSKPGIEDIESELSGGEEL